MALLLCSNGIPSFVSCLSQTHSSSSAFTVCFPPISSLHQKRTNLTPKSSFRLLESHPVVAKKRTRVFSKPSSSSDEADEAPSESDDEEDIAMLDLPLDAKLQSKLEKKLRMKVGKNVRLRRKKLVHKRRLRKKGRWPPSKMKKLSNV